MMVDTKNMLELYTIVPEKIDEKLINNPTLNPEEYKYLFYIGLVKGKDSIIIKRAESFLKDIEEKIRASQRLKTDEVISAFLACKILKKDKKILDRLNDFLEKRKDIPYSPLQDMKYIFFLSLSFDLLTENLQTVIRKIIHDRFKAKNIPVFEFILLSACKLWTEEDKEDNIKQILQRLLTYSAEEISFRDLIYIEWFYQVFREYFSTEYIEKLKNFIQPLRKNSINKIIVSIAKPQEEDHPSLNPLELVLLYETVVHCKDILVFTVDEINEKFRFDEKNLFLEKYKWQNISLFLICFSFSIFTLLFNPSTLIFIVGFIIASLIVTIIRYIIAKGSIEGTKTIFRNNILYFISFLSFLLWIFFGLSLIVYVLSLHSKEIPEWIKYAVSLILSSLVSFSVSFIFSKKFFEVNTKTLKYNKTK
jgi:hemerythrin